MIVIIKIIYPLQWRIIMRNDNLKVGRCLAQIFHKKVGIITYSGTLAIELALIDCDLPPNTGVIVSSEVCCSIINTIVKLNLTPILVSPKKNFIITNEEIEEILKKPQFNCSCILLVHQYGLANDISQIKKIYPHIKIIEDIAQAWDIKLKNTKVGEYSDYIVTSFGKTKPLSYGIGGAVITNNDSILSKVDFCDTISRNSKNILYAYAYPQCDKINMEKLFETAQQIVLKQRIIAKLYIDLFSSNKNVCFVNNENNNTWHRFPIWIKEKKYYKDFIQLLDMCEIEYQLPHEVKTPFLPVVKRNSILIDNDDMQGMVVLLRTRVSNLNEYKRKLLYLKKLMDNKV